MISKAFILLIAFSYVYSSPLVNLADNTPTTDSKNPETIDTSEKQLTRITRNNKVEYVYVNSEGEIVHPKPNVYPKITPRVDDSFLASSDKGEKNYLREKDSISSRNAVPNSSDEKLDSSDSLHYASAGGIKVRQEKSRSNVPGNLAQQSSPLTPNLLPQSAIYPAYDYLQNYPLSSTVAPLIAPISSPYSYPINYPLLLNQAYNPLYNDLYSRYANIIPDDLNIRRLGHSNLDLIPSLISNLPYLFQNRLASPLLNPLLYSPNLFTGSPYINPLLSYLLPQQTPSLNYLTSRSLIGLNGYNDLYNNYLPYYHSNLVNNLLYPGLAQNYYPNLYPQYSGAPYLNYPYQSSLPQSILPASQLAQPPSVESPFAGRRISTPVPSSTTTTVSSSSSSPDAPATATVINPFSDSVVSISNSPSVVVPGHVAESSDDLKYSNQNAAASLRSPIYDTTLLHGGSYLGSPYYNGVGYPYNLPYRYPSAAYSSGYYSRLNNYYQTPGYSSIYRPGFISTYPPYYNGVGYPYSSMHYSADPSSILGRSAVVKEDSKATVPKEESKSSNLMYTVKTSKSESKETVSRLNDHETPKILDDNKKA